MYKETAFVYMPVCPDEQPNIEEILAFGDTDIKCARKPCIECVKDGQNTCGEPPAPLKFRLTIEEVEQ